MKHRMSSGFGLIELLLVVAIIGILAGLILSAGFLGREKAHDSAIENAIRQVRWQAEIAGNGNGGSFINWAQNSTIQTELGLLLDEIDKHYGDTDDMTYVTVMRESQLREYCASAPSRAEPGKYYCVDSRGELKFTDAHCPDNPIGGAPLRCP